jgi:transposase
MTKSISETVGVDISKEHLDVFVYPSGAAKQFGNDAKGHRSFERTLAAAGFPMAKINPRHARRFAEATGKLAKTDAIDAAMLARFGALLTPKAREPISPTLDEMKDFLNARNALVKERTATLNRQQQLRNGLLKRLALQRIKQLEGQLKTVDAALQALCDADPVLKVRFKILVSIPGVGASTALALPIDMPEIGTLENSQAASLAGLARCQ